MFLSHIHVKGKGDVLLKAVGFVCAERILRKSADTYSSHHYLLDTVTVASNCIICIQHLHQYHDGYSAVQSWDANVMIRSILPLWQTEGVKQAHPARNKAHKFSSTAFVCWPAYRQKTFKYCIESSEKYVFIQMQNILLMIFSWENSPGDNSREL